MTSVLISLVTSFGDVFANGLSQIRKTDMIELKIELDTDKPITISYTGTQEKVCERNGTRSTRY